MVIRDRATGQRYQLVKRFAKDGEPARYQEAGSGRRYNLMKRYL
jgi:hypothetical protein